MCPAVALELYKLAFSQLHGVLQTSICYCHYTSQWLNVINRLASVTRFFTGVRLFSESGFV